MTRRDVMPALAFDLPVALIASVLAFALDADGGVGAFALGAGSFFLLTLSAAASSTAYSASPIAAYA